MQQAALNSRVFYYFTMIKNAEGNPSNTMNSRSFIINQNERLNEFFARKEEETDQRRKKDEEMRHGFISHF